MEVEKYFNAEKQECQLGIGIGTVSLAFAIYFFMQGRGFSHGLAIIFAIFSIIQYVVCITVVLRAPKDIERVNQFITQDKSKIKTDEIPRIKTVLKNFVIYRWCEIFISVLGLILFWTQLGMTQGIGLALLLNGVLLLVFDFFAERRGKQYLQYLKNLL